MQCGQKVNGEDKIMSYADEIDRRKEKCLYASKTETDELVERLLIDISTEQERLADFYMMLAHNRRGITKRNEHCIPTLTLRDYLEDTIKYLKKYGQGKFKEFISLLKTYHKEVQKILHPVDEEDED